MPETLDRIDFEILSALQKEGRLSNKELADQVGLAPSTCLQRVRQLEESGVLRGSHAEVDASALGIRMQALIAVQLQKHSRELVERFREDALALPEVIASFHIAGEYDFLLHVAVADADHLRDFALDNLTTRPEIDQLETWLIFEHAERRPLPVLVDNGGE
ncbi:MAG: Lrp/AsnC family transcriptional regulator [Persicimonas sp.]